MPARYMSSTIATFFSEYQFRKNRLCNETSLTGIDSKAEVDSIQWILSWWENEFFTRFFPRRPRRQVVVEETSKPDKIRIPITRSIYQHDNNYCFSTLTESRNLRLAGIKLKQVNFFLCKIVNTYVMKFLCLACDFKRDFCWNVKKCLLPIPWTKTDSGTWWG